MRPAVPLFPVPTGFGNLFAAAFEVPTEPHAALDAFEHGTVRAVDAGVAGGEVFLCHASYGLLANVQQAGEDGARAPRGGRGGPSGRRWRTPRASPVSGAGAISPTTAWRGRSSSACRCRRFASRPTDGCSPGTPGSRPWPMWKRTAGS